jgi:hypothetical protein
MCLLSFQVACVKHSETIRVVCAPPGFASSCGCTLPLASLSLGDVFLAAFFECDVYRHVLVLCYIVHAGSFVWHGCAVVFLAWAMVEPILADCIAPWFARYWTGLLYSASCISDESVCSGYFVGIVRLEYALPDIPFYSGCLERHFWFRVCCGPDYACLRAYARLVCAAGCATCPPRLVVRVIASTILRCSLGSLSSVVAHLVTDASGCATCLMLICAHWFSDVSGYAMCLTII